MVDDGAGRVRARRTRYGHHVPWPPKNYFFFAGFFGAAFVGAAFFGAGFFGAAFAIIPSFWSGVSIPFVIIFLSFHIKKILSLLAYRPREIDPPSAPRLSTIMIMLAKYIKTYIILS